MPTEYCKLTLVPSGFFDRNPVLDLPHGNGSHGSGAGHHHHSKL